MPRRTLPLAATIALASGSALLTGSPALAGPTSAAATTVPTHFAMQASGYGSRVGGGSIPASSDKSAFQIIGCTNLAGLSKTNAEAQLTPASDLTLSAVKTHVWTTKTSTGAVNSWASHKIATATLADTASGLVINGISSISHSWHSATGFHATTRVKVADITLDGVPYLVPARGTPLDLPGIGELTLGSGRTARSASAASATVDAVRLHVTATNTTTFLAHTHSQIVDGVRTGLFNGAAYGTSATGLSGQATSGATPLLIMPCQGTGGTIQHRSIARVHLGGETNAKALTTSQRTVVAGGTADAYERAAVGTANVTSTLHAKGVVAKAHVTRTSGGAYTKDTRGTSTGTIVYNGHQVAIPASGVLRIAGVARIESNVVSRTRRGISVTALRVTLLDGSLAVINIAHAKVSIAPSGL
jgi:hypothetical protein